MSHSFKHTKHACCCSGTNKGARSQANRALRRKTKMALIADAEVLPVLREVSNTWTFPTDGLGKVYPDNSPFITAKDLRK